MRLGEKACLDLGAIQRSTRPHDKESGSLNSSGSLSLMDEDT